MQNPIQVARRNAPIEEIDYVFLSSVLQDWEAPRNVIQRLLRKGDLIRVKKGIYVFGADYARRPYSLEVLANKIYGPSYISAEYALSFWGLIPEGVAEVTSMTTKKNKLFETPVGRFSYTYINPSKYPIGVTYIQLFENIRALIATPEKALVDFLVKRNEKPESVAELKKILLEDFRIGSEALKAFNLTLLKEIAAVFNSQTIQFLVELIKMEKHAK